MRKMIFFVSSFIVLQELVLAGVELVANDVGVIGSLRADLCALRVEPVFEDRARGAEEDERGIGQLARVHVDPRVRLVVRNLLVPDLHRVRARVQEEAFAPDRRLSIDSAMRVSGSCAASSLGMRSWSPPLRQSPCTCSGRRSAG